MDITRRWLWANLRWWLRWTHRWVGIATCALFVMWFLSGLVMMYVGFPEPSEAARLAALPALDPHSIALAPNAVLARTGLAAFPRDLRLAMLDDEPVYRLMDADGRRRTLSAVDGRAVERINASRARAIAERDPRAKAVGEPQPLWRDQWSVTARFDPQRPLYLVPLGDDAGTEVYVSAQSGEVVLDTAAAQRFWNWFGAIPHWIYPTVLRQDGALWRSVVLWVSGIGLVVAVTGPVLGILRLKRPRAHPARPNPVLPTPYRGWFAWHHITGLLGGGVLLTWMFSGWLSLDPGRLFDGGRPQPEALARYTGHSSPDFPLALPGTAALPRDTVELRFVWLADRPFVLATDRSAQVRSFDDAGAAPIDRERLVAAAAGLLPHAEIAKAETLTAPDAYWYAHHRSRILPVLRIAFDDADQTWVHIDPRTGDVLGMMDRRRRLYRWLYNGLHSLDFPGLVQHRPLWDAVLWPLLLLGSLVSVSGTVLGWRRLARRRRRAAG